uniref:Secreted protein n=1 Tax=Ascaris lumbricoides TaxID=6252 RepID=A0A0M3HPP8_ASCLU
MKQALTEVPTQLAVGLYVVPPQICLNGRKAEVLPTTNTAKSGGVVYLCVCVRGTRDRAKAKPNRTVRYEADGERHVFNKTGKLNSSKLELRLGTR